MKNNINRWWMINALSIFVTTTLIAVVANSLNGYGFHLNYSISRYVGLEMWSSIMFGVGNFFVAYFMLKFLWTAGRRWRMGWYYFVVVIVMLLALLGLSVCPIGRFDRIYDGEPGPVSLIHEFCSRTMFLLMLVISWMALLCQRTGKRTRIACGVFIVIGTIYGVGYLLDRAWLKNNLLIFESMYLVGFMALCLFGRSRNIVIPVANELGENAIGK